MKVINRQVFEKVTNDLTYVESLLVEEVLASYLVNLPTDDALKIEPILKYRNIELDLISHRVLLDGEEVKLGKQQFQIIRYLIESIGVAIPFQQILKAVWGKGYESKLQSLRVNISMIRQKLGQDFITSVTKVGYRLESEQ